MISLLRKVAHQIPIPIKPDEEWLALCAKRWIEQAQDYEPDEEPKGTPFVSAEQVSRFEGLLARLEAAAPPRVESTPAPPPASTTSPTGELEAKRQRVYGRQHNLFSTRAGFISMIDGAPDDTTFEVGKPDSDNDVRITARRDGETTPVFAGSQWASSAAKNLSKGVSDRARSLLEAIQAAATPT